MPFTPTQFLGPIVAADAAYPGRFARLTVQHRRPRLGLAAPQDPANPAKLRVPPCPNPLHAPQPAIMVDRLPWRPIMRQPPPGTATAQTVEKRVHDLPHRMPPRAAPGLKRGQVGCERCPFRIAQITRLSCSIHRPYRVRTAGN